MGHLSGDNFNNRRQLVYRQLLVRVASGVFDENFLMIDTTWNQPYAEMPA